MAPLPCTTNAESLRRDFYSSPCVHSPLKDAPIVSLRALEHGDDFEDIDLRSASLWRRALMTVRRRFVTTWKERLPVQESFIPLRLLDSEKRDPDKSWRKRRWGVAICIALPVLVLCFFGFIHVFNVISSFVPLLWDDPTESMMSPWTKYPDPDQILASYSKHLTQDVVPIRCHSHNDYWRKIPLYEALKYGCTGVEADVWLFDEELFVGHSTNALTANRTFRSMYVDPLVTLIDRQNEVNGYSTESVTTKNGVFETVPSQTLVLLVDFKNDGPAIYPHVFSQLAALRERKYLTYFDGETIHSGPITVVATGNAPFDLITENHDYRDIFFDAPLDRVYEEPSDEFSYEQELSKLTDQAPEPLSRFKRNSGQGTVGTDENTVFDSTNSYYASVNFKRSIGRMFWGKLSEKQIKIIRGQIQGAHRRGLKARYWGTPSWPVSLRNHVWEVLVQEGADYLNGDDLEGMTKGDWRLLRHHDWLG